MPKIRAKLLPIKVISRDDALKYRAGDYTTSEMEKMANIKKVTEWFNI